MIKAQPLPYEKDLFTPVLTKETLDFHYDKHHLGYVKKLNSLIKNTKYSALGLKEIIMLSHKSNHRAIYNNAAQIWNHDFYWQSIGKECEKSPELSDRIYKDFGDYENFTKKFIEAGITLFGSGWIWLIQDKNTMRLSLLQTSNADNSLIHDKIPLLTIDVWEHTYYIDYRNDRLKYLNSIVNYLQWRFAFKNMKN